MKRLIHLLKDIGFTHIEIAGKTRMKGEVLPAILEKKKGIYIIVADRNLDQCEWDHFISNDLDDLVLPWNGFGLTMQDHILYVGISNKHLKVEIDRHTRAFSYDARALKLVHYRCPEFNYVTHAFFLDPENGYNQIDLDNLEAFVKKYLKPVIGKA